MQAMIPFPIPPVPPFPSTLSPSCRSIPYILAIRVAYSSNPRVPLTPQVKAFLTLAAVFSLVELAEPLLRICEWKDFSPHSGISRSIVPVVVLYESLVGTGYATLLYERRLSHIGLALAFGLPLCLVSLYSVSLYYPIQISALLAALRRLWPILWLLAFFCLGHGSGAERKVSSSSDELSAA